MPFIEISWPSALYVTKRASFQILKIGGPIVLFLEVLDENRDTVKSILDKANALRIQNLYGGHKGPSSTSATNWGLHAHEAIAVPPMWLRDP